jgi:septal ring factor EnvC (AmiA/AmiB activator)
MSSFIARAARRIGRSLEPLIAPDAEAQRARLDRLTEQSRDQQHVLKTLASEVSAHRAEVRKLIDAHRDQSLDLQARVADLRASVRRQDAALRLLARRGGIEAEL